MAGTAGNVTVVLSANTTNFSAALTEAQKNLDRLANASKTAGHSTVSSMQAASASIRLLDNPLGSNIRAIERLISQSQVLSTVMKAAFPLVGAVAIGAMIARLGNEVADFVIKVNKIPEALKLGFQSMDLSATTSLDHLRLTNAELQNNINKLTGTPQNNLAIQLNEARLKADDLASSLEKDAEKAKALLEQNQVTFLGASMTGRANTGTVSGTVRYGMTELQNAGYAYNSAVHAHGGDSAEAKQALDFLHGKQDYYSNWVKTQTYDRQHQQGRGLANDMGGDQADNLSILNGFGGLLSNQRDTETAHNQNADLNAQNKKLEAQKEFAASQKTADGKRLEAMKASLAGEGDNQAVSVKQTYDFWNSKISAFTKGSTAYDAVVKLRDDARKEGAAKSHEAITKFQAEQLRENSSDQTELPRLIAGGMRDMHRMNQTTTGEDTQGYMDSNNLAIQNAANEAREKEAALTDQAGRSITRYAAALQIAQVHAQEFATQMSALRGILDTRTRATDLDPTKENLAAQTSAQEAVNRRQTQYNVQQQSDNDNTYGRATSGLVGFGDALDEFVQSTRDMAKTIGQLTASTLGSFNNQVVRTISGQSTRGDWSNMGAGMFRSAAGASLQHAEGSVFGALGFGAKADGSKTSPLYVRMADGVGNLAGGAASGLGSLFHQAASSSSASGTNTAGGIGSTIGSVLGKVMGFLPHFATGGPVSSNMLSVVGENGPELFNPSTSGTIIPNHQLTGVGGSGDTTHNWNIDARGSTDPAQTMAMVQEGIRQATPHIIRATQASSTDNNRRGPTGARK